MLEKIKTCVALQEKFNSAVNPGWRNAGYQWNRAMWIEAGEMADHVGYKWWKNIDSSPDREQVLLELVDIFHFYLSSLLQTKSEHEIPDHIANNSRFAEKHTRVAPNKAELLAHIDLFVNLATTVPNVPGQQLTIDYFRIVYGAGFTINDILDGYIGKNVLNFFRLNNGYKTGTYVKIWGQKEDNVVLSEILASGDRDFDSITQKLNTAYIQATIVNN